jgi:hypothetical protein
MKIRVRTILGITVAAATIGAWGAVWAAGEGFLAEKHQKAGIECAGCHKESPPKAAVSSAACGGCHGDAAGLAAKTAKAHPNPHASHQGELPCETCHRAHARSVDYCAQCHDFGLKVP